jgi:Fic/DOC family
MLCPPFEYGNNSGADAALKRALVAFFQALRTATDEQKLRNAENTRAWHAAFFHELTPSGCEYYAGNYRGEDFFCLREYDVRIPVDPLVGAKPQVVALSMVRLREKLHEAAALLDLEMHRHANPLASKEFLVKTVQVVAYFFVAFLTIHPYANGNGHMARLIIVLLLDRYGIRAPRFPIHPRPQDPPYSDAIYRYRRNDTKSLEILLLKSLF